MCGLVSIKCALVLDTEQLGKEPTSSFGFVVYRLLVICPSFHSCFLFVREFPVFCWAFAVLCCAMLTLSHVLTLCDPMDCSLPGSSVHEDSPGKNTGVSCHALFQRIFPTQVSNSGLPHCGQILYQLSHQRSPRTLEWVAYPFCKGSSQPRNQTGVSCIAGRFFTN